MSRYIDAEALCELARNHIDGTVDSNDIMRFPVADVQDVKHGHWREDEETGCLQCSECGHFTREFFGDFVKTEYGVIYQGNRMKYCPKCGALMMEDKHD